MSNLNIFSKFKLTSIWKRFYHNPEESGETPPKPQTSVCFFRGIFFNLKLYRRQALGRQWDLTSLLTLPEFLNRHTVSRFGLPAGAPCHPRGPSGAHSPGPTWQSGQIPILGCGAIFGGRGFAFTPKPRPCPGPEQGFWGECKRRGGPPLARTLALGGPGRKGERKSPGWHQSLAAKGCWHVPLLSPSQ